jgi:hypothetical protein
MRREAINQVAPMTRQSSFELPNAPVQPLMALVSRGEMREGNREPEAVASDAAIDERLWSGLAGRERLADQVH